jgi:hypothetical protein
MRIAGQATTKELIEDYGDFDVVVLLVVVDYCRTALTCHYLSPETEV